MTLPGDSPDDYQWLLGAERSLLEDQAELAVRTHVLSVYDRRGQVIWGDRGGGGLSGWAVSGSGTGNSVKVTAAGTYFPGFAFLMTAGSTLSLLSQMVHYFSPAERNRWGVEIAVGIISEFDRFSVYLARFDGSFQYLAAARMNRTLSKLQVWGEDNDYHDVAALSNPVNADGIYQHLKLVADFDAGRNVRLLYNENEYDVSAYGLGVSAATDIVQQRIALNLFGRAGQNDTCRIGNVILTVGEP